MSRIGDLNTAIQSRLKNIIGKIGIRLEKVAFQRIEFINQAHGTFTHHQFQILLRQPTSTSKRTIGQDKAHVLLRLAVVWLIVFAINLHASSAQASNQVSVFDFTGKEDELILSQLADQARAGAALALPSTDFLVLSKSRQRKLIEESGFKGSCDNDDCIFERSSAINANLVLTGVIFQSKKQKVLTLKLYEATDQQLIQTRTIEGYDIPTMLETTKVVSEEMLLKWFRTEYNKPPICHITGPFSVKSASPTTTISLTAEVEDPDIPNN